MAELITALVDLGIGLYAYRLARENRNAIQAVKDRLNYIETLLKKAGLLDGNSD